MSVCAWVITSLSLVWEKLIISKTKPQTLGRMKTFSRKYYTIDSISQRKKNRRDEIFMSFYFSYVIFLHSGILEMYGNGEAKGKINNVLFEDLWKYKSSKLGYANQNELLLRQRKCWSLRLVQNNCTFLSDIHLKTLEWGTNLTRQLSHNISNSLCLYRG